MANNSNGKFNWARKKNKVRRRRKIRKAQIRANKLAKANRRKIDKTMEIENNTAEIIPVLQTEVEDDIMKAWNKRKVLRVGDIIEITESVKAKIIEVSDDTITYKLGKEKKCFDLRNFAKMITKFNLTIFPSKVPA